MRNWTPVLGLVVLWRVPGPMWQDDLAALTPVPRDLLLQDAKLRGELGAPDVRYLLVLEAGSEDGVLALSESLEPRLTALVEAGVLDAVELPSRYLPSLATQRARQARLPSREVLAAALQQAGADLPFRSDLFDPFLDDVDAARTLAPTRGLKRAALFALSATVAASTACGAEGDDKDDTQQPSMSGSSTASAT